MRTAVQKLALIGYECGVGAGIQDCAKAPSALQRSKFLSDINHKLQWQNSIKNEDTNIKGKQAVKQIAALSKQLANQVAALVAKDEFFVTVGGDHSCAIGTWSGVATAISPLNLGLIWIDAHLDAHTMETTPSGNIHGMPLAALLGHGEKALTEVLSENPKLLPSNLCIIGARSYEQGEKELLDRLNVKVFYMDEVIDKGFAAAFAEAIAHITQNSQYFGISIDLDAISPEEAPGVGTPEPNGIKAAELLAALKHITPDPRFVGAEIVEYNPDLDHEQKTEKIAADILKEFVHGLKISE